MKKYILKTQYDSLSSPIKSSAPQEQSRKKEIKEESCQDNDSHTPVSVLMGSCAHCMPVASYAAYQLPENFTKHE